MRKNTPLPLLSALLLGLLLWQAGARAQIPTTAGSLGPDFKLDGMTDQPFTVEVLDTHRTVENTLLVRLALTNHGTAPLQAKYEFSLTETPAEEGKISGVYAIDANGELKYSVLRNARGVTVCSRIDPALQPGERRMLFTQLSPPADTSSSVTIFIPHAGRISNVPIGLPSSGENVPPDASIGDPGAFPAPFTAVQPALQANGDQRTTKINPDFITDQLGNVPAASSRKAIGSIQDGNSEVPFTIEALGLKRESDGRMKLRLAMTNNSSGPLDTNGQFNSGIGDLTEKMKISGVYLVDPVSHVRFEVLRPTQISALCSSISPAMAPGERRVLEAEFAGLPAAVKSVYVYFPHATAIPNIPVESFGD